MFVALLGSSRDEMKENVKKSACEVMAFCKTTPYGFVLGGASGGIMKEAYEQFYEKGHEMVVMQSLNRKKDDCTIDPHFLCSQKDNFDRTRSIYEKSDGIVFLPGGVGTYAEFFSILDYEEETKETKPILLYNETGEYDTLLKLLKQGVDAHMMHPRVTDHLYVEVKSIEELEKQLKQIEKRKKDGKVNNGKTSELL